MTDRYFTQTPIDGDRAVLAGPEAHHLIHVKRARQGGRVTLFDGTGDEFPARIERIRRSEVELAVLGRDQVDRELPVEFWLAAALPKGDRQKWLVEKAVELGVARIVPIETNRSVAQPVEQALARLRRTVIEASKQCGRNRLMEIDGPQSWADFVDATRHARHRLLAHPTRRTRQTEPSRSGDPLARAGLPNRVLLAVGPEGGFSSEEYALATTAGWQPIDLGERILRVETAALVLVAVVIERLLGPQE